MRSVIFAVSTALIVLLSACTGAASSVPVNTVSSVSASTSITTSSEVDSAVSESASSETGNIQTGLVREQTLDSTEGLIHYSYYLPEDYDPTRKYPMMVVMPGYHAAANVVFDDADILNWIVSKQTTTQTYTRTTPIETVRNDPVFGDYGRLIFPVERSYYSGDTLEQLHLTYYNNIDPDETVDICNTLRQRAADGQTIFYDIYTEDEKAADPDKADTGLFYFKGNPGAKFAICNAGGAFAYVGAMQDSFPHALELSRKEYNAFALIYRPGAQTACEDLARAIAFVFTHAEELEVDTSGYSLWGGSAGARMAAWLGSYGTASFGEQAYPQPGAVIMQYTGLGEVYGNEPPTYACVGDRDYIADERVMRWRIETIRSQGTPAEIEVFPGLAHGFGLGTGTSAEGWLDHAVAFWEENT